MKKEMITMESKIETYVFVPTAGTRLRNGATLIAFKTGRERQGVVLAMRGGEYVTWAVDTRTGDAYWGHYFQQDFAAAAADYQKRG
jgi:hypothetical protein